MSDRRRLLDCNLYSSQFVMTPDETHLLQVAGQTLLMNIAGLICAAVFYGIYLILSTMAMISLWTSGLKAKPALIQFLALIFICMAYSIFLASDIACNAGLLRGYLVLNPDDPLRTRFDLANSKTAPWNGATGWLAGSNQGILFWVGDAVVVWRACVMFPQHTKIKSAMILSLICGIALAICGIVLNQILIRGEIFLSDTPVAIVQLVSSITFVLLNVVASTFIAWKTYKYRQFLKAGLGKSRSISVKAMILLVESGVAYCCIQTIALISNYLDVSASSSEDWFARIWLEFTIFASAIYPVVIILLVNHQRSIANTPGMTEVIENAGVKIEFAATPPARNATDSLLVNTVREVSGGDIESVVHAVEVPDLEKGARMVQSCP